MIGVAFFGWLTWSAFARAVQYKNPERATLFFLIPILVALLYDNLVQGTKIQSFDMLAFFLILVCTVLKAILNLY